MSDPDDEKRRDEVLKRMLATPPKPHDGKAEKRGRDEPEKKMLHLMARALGLAIKIDGIPFGADDNRAVDYGK
ncbi:hypothetical protein [Bosea sp. OK403]|uniref:hypothetical protein n=1 Tax=Bosea sp. OK403 TaxID=1855286 RepID=UPI000B839893|nr:hypothetical protein [Bosea sp. OK403]